ncbi:hypothetical protein ACIQ7Q_17410 [Streptomyces sp. NPDC096176]|uniref:hypothetical protein n=1 Tax=Streptomyces sp. NPDC096176 TaxID=3366079 RepID=UPI0037F6C163
MSSDQQYPQYPSGQQQPYPSYEDMYGQQPHQGAGETQTWQGETWDTQYQPVVRPAQPAPEGATAYGNVVPPAADTAYHPVTPVGGGPLPPEARTPGAPYGHADAYAPGAAPDPDHAHTAAYAHSEEQAHAAYGPAAAQTAAASEPAADATGYSTPSIGGNARITDAQRARAEGRSPIIAPGMQPAGLTAVLALLLVGGAALGPYALLVPLVLLQAVTAAGWFRLNGMWPARQGIALAFLGGVAADTALLASGEGNAAAAIVGTLGVWVLLTLVLQLRSQAGPDERMQGLMATVASAALAILATGHLAAAGDAVVVGAVAVAVATLARALPLPGPASVVLSLLAAAGAGIAVGGLTDLGAEGALLGLAAGGCALIGLRVASYDYPSRFVHMTAGVALPLTAAAPAVHLIGRALA